MKIDLTKEMEEHLKTLTVCELTKEGWELHNPKQQDVPIALKAGPTLKMRIAALMRENQQVNSVESLEESMDFDVGDDMVAPVDDTSYMVPEGPTEAEQTAQSLGMVTATSSLTNQTTNAGEETKVSEEQVPATEDPNLQKDTNPGGTTT